jgi:hypothetical protein
VCAVGHYSKDKQHKRKVVFMTDCTARLKTTTTTTAAAATTRTKNFISFSG